MKFSIVKNILKIVLPFCLKGINPQEEDTSLLGCTSGIIFMSCHVVIQIPGLSLTVSLVPDILNVGQLG